MQNRYPFILKVLDKDPKTSVQYHSDWDIRDSCFCLAHFFSEFFLKYGRHLVSNKDFSTQGLYSLPSCVYPKDLMQSAIREANFVIFRDYMNLFFEEHKYRFKEEHKSAAILPTLNKNIEITISRKILEQDPKPYPFDFGHIPKKFYRDDFNEPFKEKKDSIRSASGRHLAWKVMNTPSVVNTMRTWYVEEVLPSQVDNGLFTGRQEPPFLRHGTGAIPAARGTW